MCEGLEIHLQERGKKIMFKEKFGIEKDSNPGIIPREELDMVQLELQRREKLRYSYSSKDCFSSKLICADCGHLYGSRV